MPTQKGTMEAGHPHTLSWKGHPSLEFLQPPVTRTGHIGVSESVVSTLAFSSPLRHAGSICHQLSARSFRSWIPHRNYSSWTGPTNWKSERGERVSSLNLMGCVKRAFKSPDHHPGSLYITAHHSWTRSSH